jgi:hypothetical protein
LMSLAREARIIQGFFRKKQGVARNKHAIRECCLQGISDLAGSTGGELSAFLLTAIIARVPTAAAWFAE